MTAIVGILCKNGVVIGADSSATFGQGRDLRTIEQPTEKISIIDNHIIIAGTGQIGLAQRFEKIIQDLWAKREIKGHHIDCGKLIAKAAIDDFISTNVNVEQFGALVAFPVAGQLHLCEFAVKDMQPEFMTQKIWYNSMGSAKPITDTFLAFMRDIFWKDGPPGIADGIFSVLWILEMAVKINPGGVNGPVRIAVLSGHKGNINARMLTNIDLQEHYQAIEDMKTSMQKIACSHSEENSANVIPTFQN